MCVCVDAQLAGVKRDLDATARRLAELLRQQSEVQSILKDKASLGDVQAVAKLMSEKADKAYVDTTVGPKVSRDDLDKMLNEYMSQVDSTIANRANAIMGKSSASLEELKLKFREQLRCGAVALWCSVQGPDTPPVSGFCVAAGRPSSVHCRSRIKQCRNPSPPLRAGSNLLVALVRCCSLAHGCKALLSGAVSRWLCPCCGATRVPAACDRPVEQMVRDGVPVPVYTQLPPTRPVTSELDHVRGGGFRVPSVRRDSSMDASVMSGSAADKFASSRLGHSNPFTRHHWEFVADRSQSPNSVGLPFETAHPPTYSTANVTGVPNSGRLSARGSVDGSPAKPQRVGSASARARKDRPMSGGPSTMRPKTSAGSKPSKLSEELSGFAAAGPGEFAPPSPSIMPFSENHEEHTFE